MRRYKRIIKGCEINKTLSKGRITFKCKNLRRRPTAQEIINSIKK